MVFVHFHHTSQKMRFLFKFYGNMRLSVTNRKPIAGQAVKFCGLPHNKTGASGLTGSACFAESADRKEIKRAVRDSGVVFFAETVYAVYENPPLVAARILEPNALRGAASRCPAHPNRRTLFAVEKRFRITLQRTSNHVVILGFACAYIRSFCAVRADFSYKGRARHADQGGHRSL